MAFLWPMCSALNVAVLAIYGLSPLSLLCIHCIIKCKIECQLTVSFEATKISS